MEIVGSSNHAQNAIIAAVREGDLAVVSRKLEENPNLIWVREPSVDSTLLHLAVANCHEELAKVLLEKGANPETQDNAGWKPLAIAAGGGPLLLSIAELLLAHGANVDALNVRLKQTALHVCASNGFTELAQILLSGYARVDPRDVEGETPLFKAAAKRNTDIIKLLLRYGAAKNVRSDAGITLESLAAEDADITRLLKSAQLVRGPPIPRPEQDPFQKDRILVARNPAPLSDQNKMVACHAFKASVVDFYSGDVEQRLEKVVPVYDILYGQGAANIMRDARNGQMDGEPSFRWYHLPANNMEWVETLVRRHFAERSPRAGQYTDVLAADLGMKRTRQDHHLVSTSRGAFVRPFCRGVKPGIEDSENQIGRYIGAFIPYLHYEVQQDYDAMSAAVTKALDSWAKIRMKRLRGASQGLGSESRLSGPDAKQESPRESNDGVVPDVPQDPASAIGMLHRILIQGYFSAGSDENDVSPLQVRRGLMHYFYNHLESMTSRDREQVVQRYTSNFINMDPKIFMVDQLWLWVLNDDTVISCFPSRWDSWEHVSSSPTRPGSQSMDDIVPRENDPLNVFQAIEAHLKDVRREPITDVENLCRIIVTSCTDVFDPLTTPDEYHFFDFIERTVGQIMDKTAQRFQEFRMLLETSSVGQEPLSAMDIKIEMETKLLGETEAIIDELSVLRLVLKDQKSVTLELETLLSFPNVSAKTSQETTQSQSGKNVSHVLASHFECIDRIEILAKRSLESIRSLLMLKQQHASLSEAYYSRKQAEYTSQQARIATSYNKKVAHQLDLARQQAEATARQGNLTLLFTVVAVVFLPLSFITSFFTIELDGFPYNSEGKMPLALIIGIILSVSAGVSIPFILVAFNFDTVTKWSNYVGTRFKASRELWLYMGLLLLVLAIALGSVLSQPLAAQIKVGVGIGLSFLLFIVLGAWFVFRWSQR